MDARLEEIRAQLSSENEVFGLVIRFKVFQDRLPEFTKLARRGQSETLKESGVVDFRFFTEPQNPRNYVLTEIWRNFAALRAHFETPHFKEYIEKSKAFIDGEPQIEILVSPRES
jgi:quinol monooxygenase YgiN